MPTIAKRYLPLRNNLKYPEMIGTNKAMIKEIATIANCRMERVIDSLVNTTKLIDSSIAV